MTFEIPTINIAIELFGILICLTVILCRNFFVESFLIHHKTNFSLLVFCEALLLFVSAMTELCPRTEAFHRALTLFYYFRYFFVYLLLGLFTDYVITVFASDKSRPFRAFTWGLVTVSLILLTVNFFYPFYFTVDQTGRLLRAPFYLFSLLPYVVIFFENLSLIFLGKKTVARYVFISFLFYVILPVFALILQSFFIGLDLVSIAFIIVLMHMFVIMQSHLIRLYLEQKRELQESRTRIMMSQIKPHFLFNALTSIAQLCDDDPALAKSTTIAFADYLRGNLRSLDQADTVPFETELDHIKNYLQVELTRFGELLNVEYDIGTVDFRVPVLSIQPLVENAVKHGVGMKEEGGTVFLSARQEGKNFVIRVRDDGVGFDPAALENSGGIGIRSSRARLREFCGAETEIRSAPGNGTEITVLIPAETNKKAGVSQ